MDRESYRLKMDFNAAAGGIGIGLALIAGAIVHCGTESEQTRKRKALPPSDVAGDTATKGDVPIRLKTPTATTMMTVLWLASGMQIREGYKPKPVFSTLPMFSFPSVPQGKCVTKST